MKSKMGVVQVGLWQPYRSETHEESVAARHQLIAVRGVLRHIGAPVRFALCARFGFDVGRDAAAEAFTYAWENWDRIRTMDNPGGYVYRVGETAGRKLSRPRAQPDFAVVGSEEPMVEPGLTPALSALSQRQRSVVVLVHALGWTHRETADLLGLSTSSVQKHLERGLARLRRSLGVEIET